MASVLRRAPLLRRDSIQHRAAGRPEGERNRFARHARHLRPYPPNDVVFELGGVTVDGAARTRPANGGLEGVRRQEGFDGLVSVLRLHLEPSSPQRSSQPAMHFPRPARDGAMARRARFCSTGVLVPPSKGLGYWFTVTETSAGGGIRSVTSVVFFERIEMRFVHAENMPLE